MTTPSPVAPPVHPALVAWRSLRPNDSTRVVEVRDGGLHAFEGPL